MVAAATALIIGGPLTAVAVTGGDDGGGGTPVASASNPARSVFNTIGDKVTATDAGTKVTGTVALQDKAWGTETVVELKNVTGPQKCSLIAVGKNGERETASSWSVPEWGYGIPNAKTDQAKQPLYVQGGVSMPVNDIDHFEVMTFDGKKLLEIDA
jgi:hypothetical protein